jgi:small subunit ribosomal protein S1
VNESEDDFATLFEASLKAQRYEKGQSIEGTIVAISPEVAFVNVGGKGEAVIAIDELKNDRGELELAPGDRIQAVVISTSDGLTLSRKLAQKAATERQIEDAFHAGLAVEGKVEKAVKGGYEIRIARQRAFCPISQIDIIRNTTPEQHEGRVYAFRIMEYKEGGRNIVVSRRALLEAEQREHAIEVRRSLTEGAVVEGRVVSVRDFGAFVDLGAGIQGLLHISEMGWSRVSDASQVVMPGDEITVKILRIDNDRQQISLGLKQLMADPWSTVQSTYEVGQVRTGRVTRVAEFGAFVELEPGIEALAHASTFPPTGRPEGWARTVTPGMTAAFEILSIDPEKKRIGVALVPEGSTRAADAVAARPEIVQGARLTGKVERHKPYGVFVFLAPGRVGLIPSSETGVAKEGDLPKVFPIGGDVEVVVLEVDPDGRRIRLSRKAVLEAQEAAEVQDYTDRPDAAPSEAFGSLADKLRSALNTRQK